MSLARRPAAGSALWPNIRLAAIAPIADHQHVNRRRARSATEPTRDSVYRGTRTCRRSADRGCEELAEVTDGTGGSVSATDDLSRR